MYLSIYKELMKIKFYGSLKSLKRECIKRPVLYGDALLIVFLFFPFYASIKWTGFMILKKKFEKFYDIVLIKFMVD